MALAAAMAWTAFEHLRASGYAGNDNPAIIGLDRDLAAALLCALAALGLMLARTRALVSVAILLGTAYMLSARYLAGTLGYDALTYLPPLAAALFICWPRPKAAA